MWSSHHCALLASRTIQDEKRDYYLHDSTADGEVLEAGACCSLSSVFQTDFFNRSIFQAINVPCDSSVTAGGDENFSGLELRSHVWIWMCFFRCSDNSIRNLVMALRDLCALRRLTSKAVRTLGGLDRWDGVERRKQSQWWNIYQTWNPSSCCKADNRVCPFINP